MQTQGKQSVVENVVLTVLFVLIVGMFVWTGWLVFLHPTWALVLIGVLGLVFVCLFLAEPRERDNMLMMLLGLLAVALLKIAIITTLNFVFRQVG